MSQFKSAFRRENYVTDTVGHCNTKINYEDFNDKYREWEIRRGFAIETNAPNKLRGIAKLRSIRNKPANKSK